MSHQRTVYLIDDDAAARRSISSHLAALGVEVWPFASGTEFVAMLGHLRPSVVIIDIEMPHMSGLEVLAELVRQDVDWPAIALSSRGDIETAVDAMKLGAVDFLQKPVQREPIEAALAFATESLERTLDASLARQQAQERVGRLTAREVDIGLSLLRGLANKSAAHALGISVRTVEMHRAHILEKLEVKSLAEAAVLMTQAGLTLDEPDRQAPRKRFALRFCTARKPAVSLSRGSALFRTAEGGSPRDPRRHPPFMAAVAAASSLG